jgi:hypothetical protein
MVDWNRLQAVFDGALGKQGVARIEYLDLECADDAQLRSEVLALLSADESASHFISLQEKPSASSAPLSVVSREQQDVLQQIMLPFFGPVARALLKRILAQATTRQQLIDMLCQRLPEAERDPFRAALKDRI